MTAGEQISAGAITAVGEAHQAIQYALQISGDRGALAVAIDAVAGRHQFLLRVLQR